MHVCLCRNIRTSDIIDELEKRPSTSCCAVNGVSAEFAEEIHSNCSEGEGYNCGACREAVKEVIDNHYSATNKSPSYAQKRQKANA